MLVVCLEGCHGSGKTELCRSFAESGFTVLDEAFMDMPAYALHPQSLLMETMWATQWFRHVLEKASKLAPEERSRAVFVADRSPFSAVFYSRRDGALLEPVIRSQIGEIAEEAGIHIITAHLAVDPELLWSRIQSRLKLEPFRVKYREGEREWMDTTQSWYNGFDWDVTIDNGSQSIAELLDLAVEAIREASPHARRLLDAASISVGSGSPASSVRGPDGAFEASGSCEVSCAAAAHNVTPVKRPAAQRGGSSGSQTPSGRDSPASMGHAAASEHAIDFDLAATAEDFEGAH
ncbi:hypothetical protein FNF27_01177 [Cafeteria roenbergensis]|uniref:NadR/Ttd14 AAA domain-containing protein n=1 Tax=Cafeteria roenbergensis TaxID=33653 RepID=A0A5A8CJT7_CAFRO|nr:hypothetical protein FNF31_06519 [Cafeteria roenbergensis]KAA0177399.1 hypothetical protein FNF27_01177 [Cafeteria roenbergensis]